MTKAIRRDAFQIRATESRLQPESACRKARCRSYTQRLWWALAAVVAAGLACAPLGSGRDIPATVNAVSTAVQQTLAAQTPTLVTTAVTAMPAATLTPLSIITPTPFPTTNPDTAPPSPTLPPPTATAGEVTRPNGPAIHAAHRPIPPQVEGDLSDWTLNSFVNQVVFKPETWSGSEDQSASFAAAWDATYFYLAVWVVDDLHVQTQHGALIYKGDSLELLLDADLRGDYAEAHLSADDYQLGLSPGSLGEDSPEAYLWFPTARAGKPDGVVLAARPSGSGGGYYLEAAIPWVLFNLAPAVGDRYGFALSASDNDIPETAEQQSMISTAPTRKLVDPTTWGILVLDN